MNNGDGPEQGVTADTAPNNDLATRQPTTGVIIPARDEANSIALVLDAIPAELRCDVVVIDNNSHDQTAEIARRHGARVLVEPGHGYGRVVHRGVMHFQRHPVDTVVFLDGDFSDYPEMMPALLEPISSGECDFVVSTRLASLRNRDALPAHVVYGNRFCVWMMNRLFGTAYTDMGPFRAIRLDRLLALGMRDTNYGWNAEMQILAHLHGLRVMEVPVRYRRRIGISKISGTIKGTLSAGSKIIYTILRFYLLEKLGGVGRV